MSAWIGLAFLLLGFGIAVTVVLRSKNYHIDPDVQYEQIRQDKEDGMRVNIKPEPK